MIIKRLVPISTIGLIGLLIGGCERSPEALAIETNSDLIAEGAPEPEAAQSSNAEKSIWSVGVETDPMNDDKIYSASARLEDSGYTLFIQAKCINDQRLIYDLTTFEGDQGAPINSTIMAVMGIQRVTSIDVRLDGAKADRWTDLNNKYRNQFKIYDRDVIEKRADGSFYNSDVKIMGVEADHSLYASKLHNAKSATIRIQFSDGMATFVLDQTDSTLRGIIDRCPVNTGEVPAAPVKHEAPDDTSSLTGQSNSNENAMPVEDGFENVKNVL